MKMNLRLNLANFILILNNVEEIEARRMPIQWSSVILKQNLMPNIDSAMPLLRLDDCKNELRNLKKRAKFKKAREHVTCKTGDFWHWP